MSAGGAAMPGGWTLSMMWLRMPGQTWPGGAAAFLATWTVMMVAMMVPPLAPMLATFGRRGLAALAGAGYFSVWALFGGAVYVLGAAVAAAELRWPAVARQAPLATGIVLVAAGWLQLTRWKARSEEHTSELQSQSNLVCRLLLEKKKNFDLEH